MCNDVRVSNVQRMVDVWLPIGVLTYLGFHEQTFHLLPAGAIDHEQAPGNVAAGRSGKTKAPKPLPTLTSSNFVEKGFQL